MSVSFGFSKTSKRKLITAPSAALGIADKKSKKDDDDDENKIEYIQSIGLNGNATVKKEEAKDELVIPLITQNRWHFPKDKAPPYHQSHVEKVQNGSGSSHGLTNGVAPISKEEELEQQAVREILNESKEAGDKESILKIPLLVQNRIPEGYETDDNVDVTLRPAEVSHDTAHLVVVDSLLSAVCSDSDSQPTLDDYERVPIEEFGLAMLRGMGWKKEEGIGLRNKSVVEMKEPELRPRGLGLGATRPNTDSSSAADADKKSNNQKRPPSPPPTLGLRVRSSK